MAETKQYGLYNAEPVIRTFSGKYFNVFEPSISDIRIIDIAHALSLQPRFGGHTKRFYSVAQHCLLCAAVAPAEHKLAALLHDASEAYLLDIPRPIKNKLTNYHSIEDNLMRLMAKRYGFAYPLHEKVKEIDEAALQVEWDSLMVCVDNELNECYRPEQAELMFLTAFRALIK